MKMFIVKKYIMAKSAKHAINKEKKSPVDEVWIDDEWKKNNPNLDCKPIGFVNKKK